MPRIRDLGVLLEGTPGPLNAITDVPGVLVGHTTLIEGHGPLIVGKGPIRTGVTAILPRGKIYDPVFAGWYALNGNGELTGTTWVEESGFLEGPILITNTHSVGTVRDALIAWAYQNRLYDPLFADLFWSLPVVGETYDGMLNDINGQHIHPEHVVAALETAAAGVVAEGCVGGGTGMICHGFKAGIGTASRQITIGSDSYTLAALVQANHGDRSNLTIAGVPVGRQIQDRRAEYHFPQPGQPTGDTGSIIVVIATDAPFLPHQLKRIARRVPLGIGRVGAYGGNTSGDIFIAFSTANTGAARRNAKVELMMLPNDLISPFFEATAQAVEEAILNALTAAETMVGINGNTVYAMPHERVRELVTKG